jgi:hypothetical protein
MQLWMPVLTVMVVVIGACSGADSETADLLNQTAPADDPSSAAPLVRSNPVPRDGRAASDPPDHAADSEDALAPRNRTDQLPEASASPTGTATQADAPAADATPPRLQGPAEIPPATASAMTRPPAEMAGINALHDSLRAETRRVRFGTHADPATVTLGPTDGGLPRYPPYDGKNSLNFKMPLGTAVLAPLDVQFIGFKNRSARYRQDTDAPRLEPFDDLELCFEAVSDDWPGLVLCVYHLHTTPLLQSHLQHESCGIQEQWDGGGAEAGRIYYLQNSTEWSRGDPESCDPLLGSILTRGTIIGYSGQVGNNPHVGFRFKVRSTERNPLTYDGDPYGHWVQPAVFFYWQCLAPDAVFQAGVLAYPFDCALVPE